MAAGAFAAFFAAGFLAAFLAAGFLAGAFLAAAFFAGAFFAAAFFAATFLAGAFLAAAFFAGALFAAAFFAGAFLAAAFFAGAFFAAAFFAAGFFAATFLAGAFFAAAFFAAGFFAVAIIFSLIKLQRALRACWFARSDPWGWNNVQHHEHGNTSRCHALRRDQQSVRFLISLWLSEYFNPRKARHPIDTRSRGFQRSCALSSGQSFRSSTGTGWSRSGTAPPTRSAWRAGWRCSAGSP